MLDIVDVLKAHSDGAFEPEHAPERPGEVRRIALDTSRARQELGWAGRDGARGRARAHARLAALSTKHPAQLRPREPAPPAQQPGTIPGIPCRHARRPRPPRAPERAKAPSATPSWPTATSSSSPSSATRPTRTDRSGTSTAITPTPSTASRASSASRSTRRTSSSAPAASSSSRPSVIHAFGNPGDEPGRYLNFHAPGCGFGDYLRGDNPDFDQHYDVPPGSGRPTSEAVVTQPGEGERSALGPSQSVVKAGATTGGLPRRPRVHDRPELPRPRAPRARAR